MQSVIDALARGVPDGLEEPRRLGRTPKQRTADVLAYFDGPARATAPRRRSTASSSSTDASPAVTRNRDNYRLLMLFAAGGLPP